MFKKLQTIDNPENVHYQADEILLIFAPVNVREEWKKVRKWYS